MSSLFRWVSGILALSVVALAEVPLAREGVAVVALRTEPLARVELTAAAQELAGYLGQITGATFAVNPAATERQPEILLTLAGPDHPRLGQLAAGAYLLATAGADLQIVGNCPKAVRDGAHDLLHRLGVRWLQPGERWTVIPKNASLAVPELDAVVAPAFAHRDIWYAYGPGIDPSREVLKADYERWVAGNRLGGPARFNSGHTYPSTVGKHEAEFQAHPEYFAMKEDGERIPFHTHQSLCYSNPEVAKLFIADKLAELRAAKAQNPLSYTVSMDPNDSSVACFCEPCRALGNGSDQVLHLANLVARALRAEFPDAVVSFYVYASHRLPPEKVKAEPNVYVQVATAFNKTQYTLDELVARWRATVTAIGVRDYLGVEAWDWGLPGRARGSRFGYVREAIPRFRDWGAIAYNAEMNVNWGASGPAVTTAARLLWEPDADAEAIYRDWFAHAYGPAAQTMRELYDMWEQSQALTRQNFHLWYRQLAKAFDEAKGADEGVGQRLTDMVVLLHYCRLFRDWQAAEATGDADQAYAALKPMLTFTWRTRHRQIVHAYALQRRLVNSGAPVLRPLREGWHFKDPEAVFKHPEPLTDEELLAIFQEGLAATPPDTRLRTFDGPLTPYGDAAEVMQPIGYLRGGSRRQVIVPAGAPTEVELAMEGVRFRYQLSVMDADGEDVWASEFTVQTEERYETKPFALPVRLPGPGQYTFSFKAGEDYRPTFPAAWQVALEISEATHPMIRFYGPATFYVPPGTERVLIKAGDRLSLAAPGWEAARDFTAEDVDPALDCLAIPVQGELPQVWTLLGSTSGAVYFLNVPPYLGRPGQPLLVPRDALPAKP